MKHPLAAFLLLILGSCTPQPTPEPPPLPPPDAHCAESCRQLQDLDCKRGSDAVCAEFDDAGECARTQGCEAACAEAPDAYPRGTISECP